MSKHYGINYLQSNKSTIKKKLATKPAKNKENLTSNNFSQQSNGCTYIHVSQTTLKINKMKCTPRNKIINCL